MNIIICSFINQSLLYCSSSSSSTVCTMYGTKKDILLLLIIITSYYNTSWEFLHTIHTVPRIIIIIIRRISLYDMLYVCSRK
jgi:hypothetical protein